MLAELLRRLLWLPLTALLVSALTFALVMGQSDATSPFRHLPPFLNTRPADVSAQAREALSELREGESAEAAGRLSRLGGAALPLVLPALEGLPPPARARVARALRPVAARVGLSLGEDDEREALSWQRFWNERSLDFRPSTVRTLVRRFAHSPTALRQSELRTLDTAALDELFEVLGTHGPLPPEAVTQALLPVIRQALGLPPEPGPDLTAEVLALRSFWFARRLDYVALDGPGQAAALVLETQYGKWVQLTVLEQTTRQRQGRSALEALLIRGGLTLGRGLAGLGVGFAAAALFAALTAARRSRRKWLRSCVAASAAAIPLALEAGQGAGWAEVLLVAVAVAALVERRLGLRLDAELSQPSATAAAARGASRLGVALGALWNQASALLCVALASEFSTAITVALLVEWRWGLSGLGEAAAEALRESDATTLMAITVSCSLATQLAAALGAVLEQRHDPRLVEG